VKISGAERLTADGAPPYADVVPFARALVAAAPDRVLWGTDWPHPNVRHMPDDGDLVDLLADVAPDEATRHRILVDNPARLYDFRT
jgi:predicted TIM-barrel fold metal-dependent hydrolase